jgi:RNA polymerase sigma-70 factor (ECF subfamily)
MQRRLPVNRMAAARVVWLVAQSYCEGLALPASQDATTRALNSFLAGVERRAFRMARIALRQDEDALDAVQDAMLQLARRYAQRDPAEWPPLFYRILQNRVRDMQRRRMVRNKVMALLPWRPDDDAPDPVAEAPDPAPGPAAQVEGGAMMAALEVALQTLPARQREAFLLRNLEGLDVAQTALAMGCSDGSVKTHYFRAIQALKAQLGETWT